MGVLSILLLFDGFWLYFRYFSKVFVSVSGFVLVGFRILEIFSNFLAVIENVFCVIGSICANFQAFLVTQLLSRIFWLF